MQDEEKKSVVSWEKDNVGSRKYFVTNSPAHNVSHSLPFERGTDDPSGIFQV